MQKRKLPFLEKEKRTATLLCMWYVYILQCADGTLYTGITTDIERRTLEHNESDKGAKYTRARRPVTLVYTSKHENRSKASKEESRIKNLKRREKEELIQSSVH